MAFFKKENKPESHFTTPRFPIHPLIDVLTGEYMLCEKGDYTLNGGYSPHVAISGMNNSNKTLIILSFIMTILIKLRTSMVDAQVMETENTLEFMRCMQIALGIATMMGCSDAEKAEIKEYVLDFFTLRGSKDLSTNEWCREMDDIVAERLKSKKDLITLPFRDLRGEPIQVYLPHFIGIDSFSAMLPDVVTKNYLEENDAGSSDNNMMYTREMGAKTQMLAKWVNQNPRASLYMMSSAHMGKNLSLDSKAPPEKKSLFMKQNHQLKNVPEKYYFYTTTMFFVNGSAPLVNNDKVPKYPYNSSDKEKRDSKDIRLEVIILRNKFGQSGAFIPLIASQNQGIDWHLSAFDYARDADWGFEGNNINYVMELLPDVKLGRTLIRDKLLTDARLRRVVDINCEMHLMFRYKFDSIPSELRCTPKELYEGITSQGYDWDKLLTTTRRDYTIDHYTHPVQPLSTYDLLRMRIGAYIPYWMKEDEIPAKAKELHEKYKGKTA